MANVKFRHDAHKGDLLYQGGAKIQFDSAGVAEVDEGLFNQLFAQNPDVTIIVDEPDAPQVAAKKKRVRPSRAKKPATAAAKTAAKKPAAGKKAAGKKAAGIKKAPPVRRRR